MICFHKIIFHNEVNVTRNVFAQVHQWMEERRRVLREQEKVDEEVARRVAVELDDEEFARRLATDDVRRDDVHRDDGRRFEERQQRSTPNQRHHQHQVSFLQTSLCCTLCLV